MSHIRTDDDIFSDENSVSVQSNEDADSDDSSWTEGNENKKKSRSSSFSKGKAHKSERRKSLSSKTKLNKKDTALEENSDVDRISGTKLKSSKNNTKGKVIVKQEDFSDEVNSVMSDINPPSIATRSKRRKEEIRQAWRVASSTSSAFDSDGKKAKSEPILITLDSESEDDISMISSLPNRAARIRGELMRKLDRMSNVKKQTKCSGSSSSSDSEKVVKRRRNKKSKKSTLSDKIKHSNRKEVRQKLEARTKKFALKKHSKRLKAHIYNPVHKRRLKIQGIRKRFERQNIERRIIPVRQSRLSANQRHSVDGKSTNETKRSLRNSSTNIRVNYQEEEPEVKIDRRRKRSIDTKIGKEENVENTDKKNSNKNPNDPDNLIKDNENITIQENCNKTESNCKEEEKTVIQSSDNINTTEQIKEENQLDKLNSNSPNDNVEDRNSVNEKLNKEDATLESNIEKIPKVTNSEIPSSNVKILKKVGRKKKIKPLPNVVRRKGRPRKIDSNTDAKTMTETFNILNVKPQVPFLQNSFCFDVAPKLAKCRECRIAIYRSSKRMYNSYCRFMEYRKLCYNKNGLISSAGFSNPSDATTEHLNLWLPQPLVPPKDLNIETAKSLLEHIGDQFCDLVAQEKEALTLHIGLNQIITWKRVVQGVREMCDVCYTTIFNFHWVCPICGLAVCIDCYKVRKQGIVVEDEEEQPKDRDEFKWLLCTMRQPHRQDSLAMAQIIPGTVLFLMKDWLHYARDKWNIPSYCKCNPKQSTSTDQLITNGINKQLMSFIARCFSKTDACEENLVPEDDNDLNHDNNYDELDVEVSGSALQWLDSPPVKTENVNNSLKISDDYFNSFEDFALLRGTGLLHDSQENASESDNEMPNFTLDDIIANVTNFHNKADRFRMKHFNQRYPQPKSGRDPLPIRIYTKIESEVAFPSVPHSWFCNGRLLFLHQATHKDNLPLFQEQWKRGQPILVKSVDENLDMNLWHPDSFCRDFGEIKNDLVDCKTGNILKNLPMKKFWEGFENLSKRLTDENGEFLLLKLKDWPPGEDFSEKLPTRFKDLMKGLPLPEYTHRNGILNLAGRLPSSFVRPDLGPKMYNAYGSALYPTKGTTNLHLDVSDAVNVMVYVGIPSDGNAEVHVHEALKAIDEGGCDSLMRARVRARGCKPGALWHIYNARDADKIRDMLTKVAIERGEKLEAHHDPIHDQSWYIDAELRQRLYKDYGVEGYAISQCLGDAVFIPAGAPHQVRNLHSCVKVAEDFVSPENIAHCFKLTQEFRNLSDTHTNHEDKLQIKNIIHHVVKDSLSHLLSVGEVKR